MFLYGRQFMRVPSALIAYEDQMGTGTPRAQYKTSDFYLTTDPRKWDTDGDKMDDYWEIFHGINPILGDATDHALLESEGLSGCDALVTLTVVNKPLVPVIPGTPPSTGGTAAVLYVCIGLCIFALFGLMLLGIPPKKDRHTK
jgi:hypothetical protein